jgi:hypothetical protein
MDLAISSSKVFSSQHVELPYPLVHSQLGVFNQNWNYPYTTSQLMSASTSPLQMFPNMSPSQYSLINDNSVSPPYPLAKYLLPSIHTQSAYVPSIHVSNPATTPQTP